jgi:acetyl-CoA C-acetyltransferase
VSLNGQLKNVYCERYGLPSDVLCPLAMVAHQNAAANSFALFRKPSTASEYSVSKPIHPGLRLLDASAGCNGAAALVLSSSGSSSANVHLTGVGASTDYLELAKRSDLLHLSAVEASTKTALLDARLTTSDIDLFELHDAYTIMGALCLESAGFIPHGMTGLYGSRGEFLPGGGTVSSQGGLLRRGHPVGASGVYQAAEAVRYLQQDKSSRNALIQSIGGAGTAVYTHVLSA